MGNAISSDNQLKQSSHFFTTIYHCCKCTKKCIRSSQRLLAEIGQLLNGVKISNGIVVYFSNSMAQQCVKNNHNPFWWNSLANCKLYIELCTCHSFAATIYRPTQCGFPYILRLFLHCHVRCVFIIFPAIALPFSLIVWRQQ